MKTASQELTLSTALSDPLVRASMSADNVDPGKLESMLQRVAEELKPSPPRDVIETNAGHRYVQWRDLDEIWRTGA